MIIRGLLLNMVMWLINNKIFYFNFILISHMVEIVLYHRLLSLHLYYFYNTYYRLSKKYVLIILSIKVCVVNRHDKKYIEIFYNKY